jgi:hypothetical protein
MPQGYQGREYSYRRQTTRENFIRNKLSVRMAWLTGVKSGLQVKLIDFGSAVCYDVRYEPPYYDRFFGTLNFASSGKLKI